MTDKIVGDSNLFTELLKYNKFRLSDKQLFTSKKFYILSFDKNNDYVPNTLLHHLIATARKVAWNEVLIPVTADLEIIYWITHLLC